MTFTSLPWWRASICIHNTGQHVRRVDTVLVSKRRMPIAVDHRISAKAEDICNYNTQCIATHASSTHCKNIKDRGFELIERSSFKDREIRKQIYEYGSSRGYTTHRIIDAHAPREVSWVLESGGKESDLPIVSSLRGGEESFRTQVTETCFALSTRAKLQGQRSRDQVATPDKDHPSHQIAVEASEASFHSCTVSPGIGGFCLRLSMYRIAMPASWSSSM